MPALPAAPPLCNRPLSRSGAQAEQSTRQRYSRCHADCTACPFGYAPSLIKVKRAIATGMAPTDRQETPENSFLLCRNRAVKQGSCSKDSPTGMRHFLLYSARKRTHRAQRGINNGKPWALPESAKCPAFRVPRREHTIASRRVRLCVL